MENNKSKRVSKISVSQYKDDWVKCPKCGISFNLRDRTQWTGQRHLTCGQRLEIQDWQNDLHEIWCLIANVGETESNSFDAGTKVYCYPPLWGDDYENIQVVGKAKDNKRYIKIIITRKKLINFRIEKVTKPDLISKFSGYWDNSALTKNNIEELIKSIEKEQKTGA
jgi:hypothetical protein